MGVGDAAVLRIAHSSTWLDPVLNDFEKDLRRRDLAPNTARIYRWAIQDLFGLMKEVGLTDIKELSREVLEAWQDRMIAKGMKPRSRSLAIVAVRQLIKWAAKRDLLSIRLEDDLARPKLDELEPKAIEPADLDRIKAYLFPLRRNMTLLHLRDRALFAVLLSTGARVSEALQQTRTNYPAALVRQKGGRKKELLLPPEAAQMVADYLRRRKDDLPWLWVTHTDGEGHRMTPAAIREIWRKLARRLDVPVWTTHQIRHTCATELFEADVPDAVISKTLGHRSLAMLEVYRKVRAGQRQKAIDAMSKVLQAPPVPLKVKPRSRRASWNRLRPR